MVQTFIKSKFDGLFALYFLGLVFFFVGSKGDINGAIVNVGPPPASIQTAINAANPGDIVQLSSGTYIQEVLITKNLTLNGNGMGVSIIQCPTTPNPLTNTYTFTPTGAVYHPFVMAQGASNVIIQNLTIDGNSQPSNFLSNRFVGIGYHNAAGTIQNVHATNVEDSFPGGGTQHGFAIAGAVDDGNPYTIIVQNCLVDRFQKAGIDMRGNTLTAMLSNNTVTGETPPSLANANGIVIQFGAKAVITSNIVTHLISTVVGNDSVGILMIGAASNSSITNNTSNNSDIGIYSATAGNNLTISNNTVNTNGNVGIYVQDTNGLTTLQQNILTNNVNYNMFLFDSLANQAFQLGQNQFIGSTMAGLGVQGNGPAGPIVTMNSDAFIGSVGYYIQEITAPNDIWPSTASVSFDGLVSGHITFAEYTAIRTKIVDKLSPVLDPTLGLVLDFIPPVPPAVTSISPNSGPSTGGNTVTITGSSFLSSNTRVFFGSVPATNVVVVSNTVITVTVPPGANVVDVTVVTPFGTSPPNPGELYAYIAVSPLPPTNFIGKVKKNEFVDKTTLVLYSRWIASPSTDVVSYRIYKNGHLVKEVLVGSALVFVTALKSAHSAHNYSIAAVNAKNVESVRVPISIAHRSGSS